MRITAMYSDSSIQLAPVGELSFGSLEEFGKVLKEIVEINAPQYVFDFKDVSWLDSSGLGILISFHKKLPNAKLVFKNVNASVRKVIEVSRLDTIFNIEG